MPYVRISTVKPNAGREQHVEKLMRDIAESVAATPGCRESTVLKSDDSSGEIVRITIYDDDRAAAQTANDAHVMALRSELHLAVEAGHSERSYHTL